MSAGQVTGDRWQAVQAALALGCLVVAIAGAESIDEQPWQRPYTGDEATGPSVLALWQFDAGAETQDSSGRGHTLTLRGESRFVAEGKFGGCLESFLANTEKDKAQGALAQNHPDLTPQGAFTLEAWFKPGPEMSQCPNAFLVDKKYFFYASDRPEANHDYCLYLQNAGPDRRRIVAFLGYGDDSAAYVSRDVDMDPEAWHHVAFTYDGEGTGRFFFDGKSVGKMTHEGRGALSPGRYGVAIGDRYGSTHTGFPGFLDQVRLCNGVVPFFTGSLEIEVTGARTAYLRMERDIRLPVTITNDTGKLLSNGRVQLDFCGMTTDLQLPDLEPKAKHTVHIPVDTRVRPDTYLLRAIASADSKDKTHEGQAEVPITIVARPLPDQMPVVLWGSGDFERLKQIGFTHQLSHLADYAKVWAAGEPTEAATSGQIDQYLKHLDECLVNGVGAVVYLYPGRWVATNKELSEEHRRVDRSGKRYDKDNICATFPDVRQFAYNLGASVAKTFGDCPGLQASLIHSEIRDGTNLCFHDRDRQAFRKFAGYDIPTQCVSKNGVRYTQIANFPRNRVVPDDDPILTFYRWFWKSGDGWNGLHTQVHRGLKSTGRDDLWTFFDPAVRVPSVWGSGGEVDIISQWTYSYPDPIKIGQATDELFAMAEGQPGQQVMKMTQVIWYRTQTAPELPEDESKRAQWEKDLPEAQFITIAPDHMREAFWSKISRPIRGLMYHGWGSLVQAGSGSYQYTNPQTKEVLAELIRTVVRPLGPTLLHVPDRPRDVAVLESFASQMFAGRGSWGWSGSWEADAHLILQWAQIQPRIVYDETILRDGLAGIRVLVMPSCDVLTENVVKRIHEFQDRGGLIVADENACPAIMPDILLPSYKRTGKPDVDKAALQKLSAGLRLELDAFYSRHCDSSNPNTVVRCRTYGDTDYLFALNDKREFGSYVGHHGRVMERGVPDSATLSLQHPGGTVYDLVTHSPVATRAVDNGITFDVNFGPGDGRVFMVIDQPIDRVEMIGPSSVRKGAQARLSVRVVDRGRKPVAAVVPVQLEVLDARSQPAEGSGYYAARDGLLSLRLDLAPNDSPGEWTIRATELASGKQAVHKLTVTD